MSWDDLRAEIQGLRETSMAVAEAIGRTFTAEQAERVESRLKRTMLAVAVSSVVLLVAMLVVSNFTVHQLQADLEKSHRQILETCP